MVLAGEETVERGMRIPLELQQVPEGLELVGEAPTFVDVRVRGGSGDLSRLMPADVIAVLDLRIARPGRRLFQLTPEQVRAPFGVDVLQVSPASFAMVFENAATRRLPVVPAVDGIPAPGFIVGNVTADPQTVEVVGPESAVARATEALADAVSIAGAREPVTRNVTVGLLDPSLRLKVPRQVAVTVDVRPGPSERTLTSVPVHLRNLTAPLTGQAVPASVNVVLRGSRAGLDGVQAASVTAYVDLSGLGPGDYPLPVRVDEISEAGVVRTVPPTVQVHISR
jgi:YbbR domain-containing protein